MDSLQAVEPPSHIGMTPRKSLDAAFTCGGTELQVGPGGGLVSLKRGGVQWASPSKLVGQYLYETYVEADYKVGCVLILNIGNIGSIFIGNSGAL
eukprot:COSAG06_NODE_5994_length_3163_cov_2.033616_1_plen_95_part_00